MAQAAFGGVLLAGELVSMVKTLTAAVKNLSPCWPGHLEGSWSPWQGEQVAMGCFGWLGGVPPPRHLCSQCGFVLGCRGDPGVTEPGGTQAGWGRGTPSLAAWGGRAVGAVHQERVAVL